MRGRDTGTEEERGTETVTVRNSNRQRGRERQTGRDRKTKRLIFCVHVLVLVLHSSKATRTHSW